MEPKGLLSGTFWTKRFHLFNPKMDMHKIVTLYGFGVCADPRELYIKTNIQWDELFLLRVYKRLKMSGVRMNPVNPF